MGIIKRRKRPYRGATSRRRLQRKSPSIFSVFVSRPTSSWYSTPSRNTILAISGQGENQPQSPTPGRNSVGTSRQASLSIRRPIASSSQLKGDSMKVVDGLTRRDQHRAGGDGPSASAFPSVLNKTSRSQDRWPEPAGDQHGATSYVFPRLTSVQPPRWPPNAVTRQ